VNLAQSARLDAANTAKTHTILSQGFILIRNLCSRSLGGWFFSVLKGDLVRGSDNGELHLSNDCPILHANSTVYQVTPDSWGC
jgi:hypothetical protein